MKRRNDKLQSVDKHIGEQIRQTRVTAGLTQGQLAEKIGITFQQIQKYETGTNRVPITNLLALAETLNVPVLRFFRDVPSPFDPDTISSAVGNFSSDGEPLFQNANREMVRAALQYSLERLDD